MILKKCCADIRSARFSQITTDFICFQCVLDHQTRVVFVFVCYFPDDSRANKRKRTPRVTIFLTDFGPPQRSVGIFRGRSHPWDFHRRILSTCCRSAPNVGPSPHCWNWRGESRLFFRCCVFVFFSCPNRFLCWACGRPANASFGRRPRLLPPGCAVVYDFVCESGFLRPNDNAMPAFSKWRHEKKQAATGGQGGERARKSRHRGLGRDDSAEVSSAVRLGLCSNPLGDRRRPVPGSFLIRSGIF